MRKVLVWTAVALFVANVFALPRTLAALGLRGGAAPCLPIVNDGCVDCVEGLPASVPSQQRPAKKGELKPLRAGCIDVYSQCFPM